MLSDDGDWIEGKTNLNCLRRSIILNQYAEPIFGKGDYDGKKSEKDDDHLCGRARYAGRTDDEGAVAAHEQK